MKLRGFFGIENEFAAAFRVMQVWSDVQRRRPRDWLALDDDWQDWPASCLDKYVRTPLRWH